jgi:hypothetical protein
MKGIDWFLDKIAKPYLARTDALRPRWIKYLVHVALALGLSLIGVIPLIICIFACRKKR